jgi:hypothetical protein
VSSAERAKVVQKVLNTTTAARARRKKEGIEYKDKIFQKV